MVGVPLSGSNGRNYSGISTYGGAHLVAISFFGFKGMMDHLLISTSGMLPSFLP
jgi:hypothetical protein